MIILLSPAKTLDYSEWSLPVRTTKVSFLKETGELAKLLKKLKVADLQQLMSISEKLAKGVAGYVQRYEDTAEAAAAKPAVLAFKGDVYQAFDFKKYTSKDFQFLQENVRILSGFYGLLRPLDLMQPYRLEMGTALKNNNGRNLYQFWGDLVANQLNSDARKNSAKFVLNLASEEYFKVVTPALKFPVIKVDFKDKKSGTYKMIGLLAKRARGEMTDYIVKNKIKDLADVKKFARQDYRFNAKLSAEDCLVFTRG